MQSSQFPPPPPPGAPPPPYQPQFSQPFQGFQPYAPPGAFSQAPVQQHPGTLPGATVPLYTSGQIAMATFLGSLLGGSILYATNERRLGRSTHAAWAVVIGVLVSIAGVSLSLALPDGAPTAPLGIASIIGMRVLAQKRHGELVAYHINAGGKRGSNWAVFGIGVGSLVAILVPVFVGGVILAMLE